jgi:hypothetical protein
MAHWGCLVCELLSVISFDAMWAGESSRFDLMVQPDIGVGILLASQLEAWETEFVVI